VIKSLKTAQNSLCKAYIHSTIFDILGSQFSAPDCRWNQICSKYERNC